MCHGNQHNVPPLALSIQYGVQTSTPINIMPITTRMICRVHVSHSNNNDILLTN